VGRGCPPPHRGAETLPFRNFQLIVQQWLAIAWFIVNSRSSNYSWQTADTSRYLKPYLAAT